MKFHKNWLKYAQNAIISTRFKSAISNVTYVAVHGRRKWWASLQLSVRHFLLPVTHCRLHVAACSCSCHLLLNGCILRRHDWWRHSDCTLAESSPAESRSSIDIGSLTLYVSGCCVYGRPRLCLPKAIWWLERMCRNLWSRERTAVGWRNSMPVGRCWTQRRSGCWVCKQIGQSWPNVNWCINSSRRLHTLNISSWRPLNHHQIHNILITVFRTLTAYRRLYVACISTSTAYKYWL